MRQDFAGRRAIVTAAGQGIGRAIALALAERGCALLIIDIDEETLSETTVLAGSSGVDVAQASLDCTDVDLAIVRFASEPCDILINGVGSSGRGRAGPFETSHADLWDFVHRMSLTSAMACSRAVLPGMRSRGYGRIVNISSDAALRPTANMAEYAAAKAGVIGLTRALATEFGAHGVTVNAIAPGLIATRALSEIPASTLEIARADIPLNRIGTPEDVAFAACFLADERSGYITGQTMAVNGGRSLL